MVISFSDQLSYGIFTLNFKFIEIRKRFNAGVVNKSVHAVIRG